MTQLRNYRGGPAVSPDICSVDNLYVECGSAVPLRKKVIKTLLKGQEEIHHTLAPLHLVYCNLCDIGLDWKEARKWAGIYQKKIWEPVLEPASTSIIKYLQKRTNGNGNGKYPTGEVMSRNHRKDLQLVPL